MINILSPIYTFAEAIVSNAQPEWNGGIISFVMNNVLFVNSSEKSTPTDHVMKTITRGGYLAGLVCGVVWAVLLLLVGIGLWICHCRRKANSKASVMYSILANRIQYKRARMQRSWKCQAVQFMLSVIFVLIAFVMCILAFVVNAHLNSSLTSSRSEDAVIPRIVHSVKDVHDYVKLLAPHARRATKPIVDEIVYKTALMQNKTREAFSKALSKRMKGDILQDNGVLLVDYFSIVYFSMKTIWKSQKKLSSTPLESHFNDSYTSLKSTCDEIAKLKRTSSVQNLLNECNSISDTLNLRGRTGRIVNVDFEKVTLDEAQTLVNLLGKYNQTPASMRAEMDASIKKKQAMEIRLYLKSKRILKVSETIRNMTSEQWDDLESKLGGVGSLFDNVTTFLRDDGQQQSRKYEGKRNAVYLTALLLMLVVSLLCSVIFTHHFCVPGQLTRRLRNTSKILLYLSMMAMSFVVLVCMGTFLLGGYSQTEVCRYLEEKPGTDGNSSTMHLDKIINNWLDEHWESIENKMANSSSMPLPRPRDVFYGLQTSCKANKSIMLAINALDSMDPSSVSKPDMTHRFLRVGRQLMHESFRETKPEDLLRPTMKSDMSQLLKLVKELIVKPNYDDYINELRKPLVLLDTDAVLKRLSTFMDHLEAEKITYAIYGKAHSADEYLRKAVKSAQIYENEMDKQIKAFVDLKNHMNISAIVNPMLPAIDTLASYVGNKTKWISEADELYDEVIVKPTLKSSPKLMAESTVKIMGVLGPCRHLYNAVNNLVIASCTTMVKPLNLMWLFMGCSLFFLTPCIVIALLILTKEMSDPKLDFPQNGLHPNSGDHETFELPESRKLSHENA